MKACVLFFALLFLLACREDEENYPIEPAIKFANISFSEGSKTSDADTLSLSLSFTDGDADLGLDYDDNPSDSLYPRHRRIFFLKATGAQVPSDDLYTGKVTVDQLISLDDMKSPPYDTLGARYPACVKYGTGYDDRLFSIPNENHYNIFIAFLVEDPNGDFVEFDWYKEYCANWYGIFSGQPGRIGPFILKLDGPKKGELTFRMTSFGFIPLFGDNRIKLRIYIKDRALHNSNVIETAPFVLKDI